MTIHNFYSISDIELLEEIEKSGKILKFNSGDIIVNPEKFIKVIPLVLKGNIKVIRVDQFQNELFLYYINAGQSCAVSLSTCLTNKLSYIKAVAEDETELVAVSGTNAITWFKKYDSWRTFVLMTMESRFDELLKTVDSIAFSNMDERLVNFLSTKSNALKTNIIKITHQEIATELSTSREVISRLLKQLEKVGKVKLLRNQIELVFAM